MKRLIVILAFCFLAGSGCGGALSTQPGVMALVDLIQYVVATVIPAFTGDRAYCESNEKTLDIDEWIACSELQDAYQYVSAKLSAARVADAGADPEARESARVDLQRAVDEFERLRRESPVRGVP